MGNYTCTCMGGCRHREGEQVGCSLDIDECTENQTICGNNSVCTNTIGSFTCVCAEGYSQGKGEEVGCNQDVDECIENPNICGDNSVCANTDGSYTCACAEGYMPKEGEEFGCDRINTASAPSTAAGSPALTVGLAVGIGGAVLVLAAVAVVIGVRARKRSRGAVREDIELEKPGKRSNVIAYENVTDQSERGAGNPTSSVLPDVLASSAEFQAGLNNGPQGLYSLAGHFDDQAPSDGKHKDWYSNNKIAHNKAKQLATKKTQASQNQSTYNVLSKPTAKPTITAPTIQDNYNTLYDLKPTNECPGNIQSGQTGHGSPHKMDDVQYDTTYATINEDNGVPVTGKEGEDGGEYKQLKVHKI